MEEKRTLNINETKGLIIFPLPEEEFEYLCSLHGPYAFFVIAEILEWTKELDKEKLYGATTSDIRDKINTLISDYYLTDLVKRLYIKEEDLD
jgi:hypothetical protein